MIQGSDKDSIKRGRIIWSKSLGMLKENLIEYIGSRKLRSLSRLEYEAIRSDMGRELLPSYQTILSLTPESTSFSDSIRILSDGKIKLEPVLKSKTGQEFKWDRSEIKSIVRVWIDEATSANPEKPDLRQISYDNWRKSTDGETPSSATIYSRFGGWKAAIKEAREAS